MQNEAYIFTTFRPVQDSKAKPFCGMIQNIDREQAFMLTQDDIKENETYLLHFIVRVPESGERLECEMEARVSTLSKGMPRGATLKFTDPVPEDSTTPSRIPTPIPGGNPRKSGKETPANAIHDNRTTDAVAPSDATTTGTFHTRKRGDGSGPSKLENQAMFKRMMYIASKASTIRTTFVDKTMATFSPDVSTFVFPFVSAAINTFDAMLDVILIKEKIKKKGRPVTEYDLSAVIAYKSESGQIVVLSYSKELAFYAMRRLIGTMAKPTANDLVNTVGKVSEFIASSALGMIPHQEAKVEMSRPRIITRQRVINFPKGTRIVTIKFHSKFGDMCIDMSLPMPFQHEFEAR